MFVGMAGTLPSAKFYGIPLPSTRWASEKSFQKTPMNYGYIMLYSPFTQILSKLQNHLATVKGGPSSYNSHTFGILEADAAKHWIAIPLSCGHGYGCCTNHKRGNLVPITGI